MSLLVSPIVGFVFTALLFLLLKALVKRPELYREPDPNKAPPWWIRIVLWFTCTGVSYAHGSNDGQKGMGLIMLILVGIVPGAFALNPAPAPGAFEALLSQSRAVAAIVEKEAPGATTNPLTASKTLDAYFKAGAAFNKDIFPALAEKNKEIAAMLDGHKSAAELPEADRSTLRTAFYYAAETISKLKKTKMIPNKADEAALGGYESSIEKQTKFIPIWVKVAVACALGLGTMIGWKRIVVTVGEKIGKSHLTYGQGASAELVAMITILLADNYGLPVSTTHVLSSGVAGAMAANHSGLQMNTLRNLLMAWVLTLPVCVFLGAMFFAGGLLLLSHVFGVH
jgi:PiT family inorganic phosphate transporter